MRMNTENSNIHSHSPTHSHSIQRRESIRIASYPYQAIEETLVNAFYHRDYQQREPIEIRIYPNSIVFINHVHKPGKLTTHDRW